jgi:hypothetical protein
MIEIVFILITTFMLLRCVVALIINNKFADYARENIDDMSIYSNWNIEKFMFLEPHKWTFKQVLEAEAPSC